MAHLINGDSSIDIRGTVKYVNDFDFKNVKRFYQVENFEKGFIRAWHAHRKEDKYVYVADGSALIGVVNLQTKEIQKFVLSAQKPRILWIPANSANGFMSLEENTKIIFFSSSTFEESKDDDIRFPYDKWNIWTKEYF